MKPVALLTLAAFFLWSLCFAQNADRIATAVEKSLSSAPYKNVQVSVRGSVVTLTGSKLRANVEESITGRFYRGRGYRPNISIDAHNGVVSLSGYVPSPQLGPDLLEAVAHTRGVREIVNQIQLRSNPKVDSSWASAPPYFGTGVTSVDGAW